MNEHVNERIKELITIKN